MSIINSKMISNIPATKIIETTDKKFINNNIYNIISKLSVENNIIKYNGRPIGMQEFKEINLTDTLNPNETKVYQLDTTFNKFDVRTVYASADSTISISIYDKDINGFKIYESLEDNMIYDVVNVPMEDKNGGTNIYVTITNLSNNNNNLNMQIKITSLI